jgi:prepilin-type processing-associated H-X9-DG protein
VRETSRNLSCKNNLKQIGLALANYESNHRHIPTANAHPSSASPFVMLLPYLELADLYAKFDLGAGILDPNHIGRSPWINHRIGYLRCPSTVNQHLVRTDYMINRGTTVAHRRNDPWFSFEQKYPRLSDFSKGTSGTTLLSEFGSFVPGTSAGGYLKLPPRVISNDSQSEELAQECAAIASDARIDKGNGNTWWGGGAFNYYHILTPNQNSCFNGNLQYSIDTANSLHPSGVNTLWADGRVEFVTNSIDRDVWRSSGTR